MLGIPRGIKYLDQQTTAYLDFISQTEREHQDIFSGWLSGKITANTALKHFNDKISGYEKNTFKYREVLPQIKEYISIITDGNFNNYKNEYLTPQVIKDLINAGQLEQKMTKGKYKPVNKITCFMDWLYNNGYEDYLNFQFFKEFIYFKNSENTIIQYLKPCNFGRKRKR